ncbi:MAG: nucleoside triphosphate pyrophosphohydrolase [Christensenellaceae bacterium]
MIKIIGLTNEFDLLPMRCVKILEEAPLVVLQSDRVGYDLKNAVTLDDLYESTQDFDELYQEGAQRIEALAQTKEVVFGVIGDVHTNGFVQELKKMNAQLAFVMNGGSVQQAVFEAGAYFEVRDYGVFDARSIETAFFDTSGVVVITQIDNAITAADVKIKLSDYYAEQTKAFFYSNQKSSLMDLYALDRITEFGTGAVLVLPAQTTKIRYGFYDLVRIMKKLRDQKDGCPWDKEQTHKSLRPYLLEESYEVLDAIDAEDTAAIYDELGDVMLQIVFHSEIARQCGEFEVDDVCSAICAKMINRHPHIFGDVCAKTSHDVLKNWEAIKKVEKGNSTYTSVLKDVPKVMGAMMRAYKIQKKASAVGLDWKDAQLAFEKVKEEANELSAELIADDANKIEDEAGDLLFAVINVLRLKKINPEMALMRTCEKFIARFEYIETHAEGDLAVLSSEDLDRLWQAAK